MLPFLKSCLQIVLPVAKCSDLDCQPLVLLVAFSDLLSRQFFVVFQLAHEMHEVTSVAHY